MYRHVVNYHSSECIICHQVLVSLKGAILALCLVMYVFVHCPPATHHHYHGGTWVLHEHQLWTGIGYCAGRFWKSGHRLTGRKFS